MKKTCALIWYRRGSRDVNIAFPPRAAVCAAPLRSVPEEGITHDLPLLSTGGALVSSAKSERVRPAFATHVVRRRQLLLPAEGTRDGSQVLPGVCVCVL